MCLLSRYPNYKKALQEKVMSYLLSSYLLFKSHVNANGLERNAVKRYPGLLITFFFSIDAKLQLPKADRQPVNLDKTNTYEICLCLLKKSFRLNLDEPRIYIHHKTNNIQNSSGRQVPI